jgi:hypothetical protein
MFENRIRFFNNDGVKCKQLDHDKSVSCSDTINHEAPWLPSLSKEVLPSFKRIVLQRQEDILSPRYEEPLNACERFYTISFLNTVMSFPGEPHLEIGGTDALLQSKHLQLSRLLYHIAQAI